LGTTGLTGRIALGVLSRGLGYVLIGLFVDRVDGVEIQ
jgi:hypothetical protein